MVFTVMKKSNYKALLTLLILSLLLLVPAGTAHAATADEPGANRLSGKHIPEEFYGNSSLMKKKNLTRYGFSDVNSDLLTQIYTGKNYIHNDAFFGRTISNGIDVSHWNGTIDWARVKAAGIDYAFIQVGYRGYGDSGTLSEATKDPMFDYNMQNAIANGISVGVYIFSQATTTAEAQEEADYILSHIAGYNVTMPLVMDFEYADTASGVGGRLKKANLSREAATDVCLAFCTRIAEAGYTPMIYANKSMLTDQMNAGDITALGYRIWLAHYTEASDYAGTYDFWQYSSTGKVDGISTNVDMNFYYKQETDNFIPNGILIRDAYMPAIPDQAYTGVAVTPAVSLTYNGVPLVYGVDYTVTYRNNVNIGEATVIIIGRGQYCGAKAMTFKIVSPVTVSQRKKTSITIKWDKIQGAKGYQVYRSTAYNGTYKKVATIKKKSKTKFKDTNLKSGQCYYYKVRSYTKSNGKKVYGNFSPALAVYTKPDCTRRAVAGPETYLHTSCETPDTVITKVPDGAVMNVVYNTKNGSSGKWFYVTYQDAYGYYEGYVPNWRVTIEMTGKVVNTKKVNVRKSASINAKLLTTLKKNKKVTVLDTKVKKGVTWYKVTFDKNGETYNGWIAASYIKLQ